MSLFVDRKIGHSVWRNQKCSHRKQVSLLLKLSWCSLDSNLIRVSMSHGAASCFGVSSSNPEEARARPSAEGNEAYPGGAVSGDGTSRSCSAIPDATEHTAPETKRRRLIPTPPCEPPPLSLLVGYLQRAYGERSRAEEQRKRAEEALRAAEQALEGTATATAQREGRGAMRGVTGQGGSALRVLEQQVF